MSNKIDLYYLMHKNIKLAAISVLNDESVIDIKVNNDTIAKKHLPLLYGTNISKWLQQRGIPATRKGITKELGTVTPFQYMLKNRGLSLTDSYWLCPIEEANRVTWESINLYDNAFREQFSLDIDSDMLNIANKTNFIPSASLKGDLKKKWLIANNGSRVLVKGNYNDSCIQSISEVLATKIYDTQPYQVAHTRYQFIDITSDGQQIIGCVCKAFTRENLELITAYELLATTKKPNSINTFEWYKEILKRNNVADVDNFYDMQIMVDFIITNVDRHFTNFGVLRDADTLELVSVAPVYDSGNSLFYNKSNYIPVGKALLDIDVTSFKKKEVQLLSAVRNRSLLRVDALPTEGDVERLFEKDTFCSNERKERILRAYQKKKEYLVDFQNGADIWSYKYLKGLK